MPRDNETARWIRNEADQLAFAGYSEGDVVPVASYSPNRNRDGSTTSTTYTAEPGLLDIYITWDDIVPPGVDTAVMLQAHYAPGTDETYDVRVRNNTDGDETVLELTGIADDKSSGWVDYTPPTTSSIVQILLDHRTSPGTNSSLVRGPTFYIGAKL